MNGVNFSSFSLSGEAQVDAFSADTDESMFRQFKPEVKGLIPLPRPVLYVLMALAVVVGVAYAIVGHLIRDLAIDITECVLGPTGDEDQDKNNPQRLCSSFPPPHPFTHNAFHVWDQDDVVISLPQDQTPQTSPLMLVALPYIPSFFPHSHSSPTSYSSPALFSGGSPGQTQEVNFLRDT